MVTARPRVEPIQARRLGPKLNQEMVMGATHSASESATWSRLYGRHWLCHGAAARMHSRLRIQSNGICSA